MEVIQKYYIFKIYRKIYKENIILLAVLLWTLIKCIVGGIWRLLAVWWMLGGYMPRRRLKKLGNFSNLITGRLKILALI